MLSWTEKYTTPDNVLPSSPKPAGEGQRWQQYTTLKIRLCPTPEQAELFEKTFGCCRYIWNRMLADQQRFYDETGAPFLKEVDGQALLQEHNRLSQAFRVFFKNPESPLQAERGRTAAIWRIRPLG